MICENCNNEYYIIYGSGRFCSKRCACSFATKAKREEINKKVSITRKKLNLIPKNTGWTKEQQRKGGLNSAKNKAKLVEERISKTPFHELSTKLKKKLILKEQNFSCTECGTGEIWNEKPLSLQLDHISGDRSDNSRSNLRMLCPNCHTQTSTWGSRNTRGEARKRMQNSYQKRSHTFKGSKRWWNKELL